MGEMGGKEANHDQRKIATLRRTASILNARGTNDASGSRGREVLQCQSIVACYHFYRQPTHKLIRTGDSPIIQAAGSRSPKKALPRAMNKNDAYI